MGRRISLLRGILISAIVILSFILFSAYASFQNANRAEFASQWANHTYDALWHLDHFYSALQAASSHQRGYLLTGRKTLLIRYQRSAANTKKRLEEIAPLISDNPRQQSNWIKLKEDTEDRLKEANRTLQIAQKHALTKELRTQAIKQGSHSMSQIRHLIAQMEEEEKRLLQDRLGSEERRAKKLMTSILIETFLAVLFLSLSTWVILNQIRQRERLQKEKAQLNADTVSMMTHELKNPLTVIYSSLAALTDERKNGYLNENRHILDIALKSSRRMRRLIEDFLEIQKSGFLRSSKKVWKPLKLMRRKKKSNCLLKTTSRKRPSMSTANAFYRSWLISFQTRLSIHPMIRKSKLRPPEREIESQLRSPTMAPAFPLILKTACSKNSHETPMKANLERAWA